ncbi:hypothetical protein DK427_09345 [Methylobacterium radiodurans]|uniref:Uncharacterized protein n=1 Tax=Methylobacterium radiodurans TaxID=2202828 RepID=A0A2U8VQK8_9HYPH|nr:hypothetical protein DK427_09345 [Methylobacterium radiodurans]
MKCAVRPPPSAGEGGPRVSEGRERGATAPDEAPPFMQASPFPEAGFPSPPLLCRVPSPAVGGGKMQRCRAHHASPSPASDHSSTRARWSYAP